MGDLSLIHEVDAIIAAHSTPRVKQERIRALTKGDPQMVDLVLDLLVLKASIQHSLITALKREGST